MELNFFPTSWARNAGDEVRIYGILQRDVHLAEPPASCITVKNVPSKVLVDLGRDALNSDDVHYIKTQILENLAKGDPTSRFFRSVRPQECKVVERRVMSASHLHKDQNGNWRQKTFPMLEFQFKSSWDCKTLGQVLDAGIDVPGRGCQVFKMRDQFDLWYQVMLRRGLGAARWMTARNLGVVYNQQTVCDTELWCFEKDLTPCHNELPIPNVPTMAYDIEVYSKPDTFPRADRPSDAIFQISAVMGKRAWLLTRYDVDKEKLQSRFGSDFQVEVIKANSEHLLLLAFADLVTETKPLITLGYNNMQFDMPYMIDRARYWECENDFAKQTLHRSAAAKQREISWSSSARKNQKFQYLDAEGIQSIDLMPLIFIDHKLDSFTLGNVGQHFGLGGKDDMSNERMRKLVDQSMANATEPASVAGMTEIGAYCIRDSALTLNLFQKLNYFEYCVCLADICNVQITDLATRGTQFKSEQNIIRFCWEELRCYDGDRNFEDSDEQSYRGAVVFDPKTGRYYRIVSLDFSSLYPSLIIAYNLCPTTLVTDPLIPDELCTVMEWRDDQKCEHDERWQKVLRSKDRVTALRKGCKDSEAKWKAFVAARKEDLELRRYRPDKYFCAARKFRWFKDEPGVLPRVLVGLLDTRKKIRKELAECKAELKTCTDAARRAELERWIITKHAQQLVLKIFANAMYGFCGSKTSKLSCASVAMSTTYMGRIAIEKASKIVEREFGGNVLYGDSVSADTPVFVRNTKTGIVELKPIEDVCITFITRPDGKQQGWPIGWEVWSDSGWVPCRSVIRHKTSKQMWRVVTNAGTVDVTEDHSLLSPDGAELKPEECKIGTRLMTKELPLKDTQVGYACTSKAEAFAFGFFFADGSCGYYNNVNRTGADSTRHSWYMSKDNVQSLEKVCTAISEAEPGIGFKINNFKSCGKTHWLQPYQTIIKAPWKYLVDKYRPLFYTDDGIKKIPQCILAASTEVCQAFLEGYWLGDGQKGGSKSALSNKGKIGTAGLAFLFNRIGFDVCVNTRSDKPEIFSLNISQNPRGKRDCIKKLVKLPQTSQFVYDIEANGHFSCGIGQLVVHNTDRFVKKLFCKNRLCSFTSLFLATMFNLDVVSTEMIHSLPLVARRAFRTMS